MAAKEPGQVAYEAWIHCYFMAGHSACDSWPDLAERERAAWAAAEQWAQGSLSLHPTNQPLPPTERADEVTERISHEEARLAVFETRPANTKLLQAYITQQQALEADTVSRAELEKAIDWEVKRVAAARDARLTALQAELETEKAAVQCYMADLETERARAEEAKRQLAGLRQAIEDALPSLPEEAAPQASTVAYERVPVPEAEKRLDGELRRLAPPQASTEQALPSPAAKRPVVERYTVGQVIDDELEARGGMTPALAEVLGATFGVNPQLFLNLALAVELDAVDRCPGCGSGPEDPCGGDHEAEPAQPAPGGTERWVPKVHDVVRGSARKPRGCFEGSGVIVEIFDASTLPIHVKWDNGSRGNYAQVELEPLPDPTPAEPQGRPDISECPKCGGTYTDEHEGPLCPPCDYVKEQVRPEQAGDRVDQLRADVARAFRALGLGGVSNHQVAEDAAAELEALRSQLRASEAECERLRREVDDVRKLDELGDWNMRREDGFSICSTHVALTPAAARHAAVEYLEKERKDG